MCCMSVVSVVCVSVVWLCVWGECVVCVCVCGVGVLLCGVRVFVCGVCMVVCVWCAWRVVCVPLCGVFVGCVYVGCECVVCECVCVVCVVGVCVGVCVVGLCVCWWVCVCGGRLFLCVWRVCGMCF